jgi:hypothetical protein
MEYIRNSSGLVQTILVRDNEKKSFEDLKQLSIDSNTKVYLLPEATEVKLDPNGWLISANGDVKSIWPFIKGWAMPYDCFINGFPFPIKIEEIRESKKIIEDVMVDELMWNLELPWWNTDESIAYNLAPEDVIKNIDLYKGHKERIENSDVQFPLLIVQTKQNRWLIYDGAHRFVKEILRGKKKVSCQRFSINEIGWYIPDSHKSLFSEWSSLQYY